MMQNQKERIKILSFSKSEIRGLLILFILVLGLLLVRFIIRRDNQVYSLAYQDAEVVLGQDNTGHKLNYSPEKQGRDRAELRNTYTAEPVDPNFDGYIRLINTGIPAVVAKNILAYRRKGGKFSKADDLLKIYGMDSTLLAKINRYIVIKPLHDDKKNYSFTSKRNVFTVDLNHADTNELIGLPGIGHSLSGRIIKYRNALGGFYTPRQLTEVYGITDSLYQSLTEYLVADTFGIKKIDLNTISLEELQKHPYMNRYQAKAILSYRRLVGPFTKAEQLIQNYLIPDESYSKIKPYLAVE